MSSRTKISPPIRDRVPTGFFVDERTSDLGMTQELQAIAGTLEDEQPQAILETAAEEPEALPTPRRHCKGRSRDMQILLVEDNPGDIRLIREAFAEANLPIQLSITENGRDALDFLHRRRAFAAAVRPDLVLLDLNLPLKDGRDVLDEIKQDVDLRRIPVIVLTTSQAEHDVFKAYDLHANCYIHKRLDLDHFMLVVQLLESFWFHIAQLAPH